MMRFPALLAVLLYPSLSAAALQQTTIRILLGAGGTAVARWDGTVRVNGGNVVALDPWRFEGSDGISGLTWHCSTHPARLFAGTTPAAGGANNIAANGIVLIVSVESNDPEVSITTAQGDFSFRLSEVLYGSALTRLGGKVVLDRVPASLQITNTKDEEDFPAAATDKNGDVWLAYIQFRHNPDHNALRAQLDKPPADFSRWKAGTGGDQVFVRKYTAGSWGQPIAVTAGGLDLFRTTVAVDGKGRVWVVWSQNVRFPAKAPNFEIFARPIDNAVPGKIQQVSNDLGNDVNPVATTDSAGNLWIAWQGWRSGHAAILSATESGERFATPQTVSQSSANEWNPAIAADQQGHVTVAWDSYRNENYDVFARTAASGQWGAEIPVAASARYEAYPSLAYERSGRLWVAYEEGGDVAKSYAFAGQPVGIRCGNGGALVIAVKITPTKIVRQYENDIGLLSGLTRCRSGQQTKPQTLAKATTVKGVHNGGNPMAWVQTY